MHPPWAADNIRSKGVRSQRFSQSLVRVNTAENAAINLRLGMLGLPIPERARNTESAQLVQPILARQQELNRRLSHRLPAVDQRIQAFLDTYLDGTGTAPQLPRQTFVLDQPGLARTLSLPMEGDSFASEHLTSYRLVNGILHNPSNDRRTTKGVFHIAEGGLPIFIEGVCVGAIGVGSGTSAQDVEVAKAALAAIGCTTIPFKSAFSAYLSSAGSYEFVSE